MTPIQQLIRTAAPALVMAAMFAAAPANAAEHERDPHYQGATANFASCAKPVYPAEAVKAKRTGTVTLGFEVGADGKVVDSKVEKSSGHADLDEAAREAIALCQFKPATNDGKPVQAWMKMQYVWTLK